MTISYQKVIQLFILAYQRLNNDSVTYLSYLQSYKELKKNF